MWPLMNFTEDNGPTRVVPSSHLSGKRPYEVLDEPKAPHPDLVYFGSIMAISIFFFCFRVEMRYNITQVASN